MKKKDGGEAEKSFQRQKTDEKRRRRKKDLTCPMPVKRRLL